MQARTNEDVALRMLLVQQLDRIIDHQRNLSREIPELATLVRSRRLKSLLDEWLSESEEASSLIRRIHGALDSSPGAGSTEDTAGARTETTARIFQSFREPLDGAVMKWSISRLEYQLSAYRAAAAYAETLGESSIATDLQLVVNRTISRLKELLGMTDRDHSVDARSWGGQCARCS